MVDSPLHHKQVLAAIWGKLRGDAGQLDIDGCTATTANPWATQLEMIWRCIRGWIVGANCWL
eukprot:6653877-Heterocapsa_arctica.AAC.1